MKNPIKRIFKSGWKNFFRNRTVSISSISILTTTLIIISVFFFFRGIFDYTIDQIKDKVDIKVYYRLDASDTDINQVKDKISSLPEVKSVALVTAYDNLEAFKNSHNNDPVALQALNELDGNPFGAILTIKAQDMTSYDNIVQSINSGSQFLGDSFSVIDHTNYNDSNGVYDLKSTIDRLNNIVNWINVIGYWITLIFMIMSSLIIFNTIRLSIFIFKDEISVMKLVGASNMYVRGPFLIESIIYGIFSTVLAIALLFPITYYVAQKTTVFFNGLNIYNYYTNNFFSLFGILLIISILLSLISSVFAIRKYLKI
ncbi:MAG: permease-like cell division protein FtsX [Candidatus Nomurabacteria bacterium]